MNFNFPQDIQNDTKINSKKCYTISINSSNFVSGASNNKSYFFDWSILPDVPYKLYFSFVSAEDSYTATVNLTPPLIGVDFGISKTSYVANGTSIQAVTHNDIGFLQKKVGCNITGSSTFYLVAEKHSNPPIYLEGRPRNNTFSIFIHTPLNVGYTPTIVLASYYLILYFEPL